MWHQYYPQIEAGKLAVDELEADPNIRWLPKRLLPNKNEQRMGVPGTSKIIDKVNNPIRDLLLFYRPAYILNALGNQAMLMLTQGPMSIPNTAKGILMHRDEFIDQSLADARIHNNLPEVNHSE